jgi:putative ABC transport system substrate-binding protein
MNRGDFASLFGRVAAALPLPGYVQQPGRVRRIGVLSYFDEQDPQSSVYLTAFLKQLEEFGWTIGKNLQVESRWTGCDADRIHQYAAELVALAPDVILAPTTVLQVTRRVELISDSSIIYFVAGRFPSR